MNKPFATAPQGRRFMSAVYACQFPEKLHAASFVDDPVAAHAANIDLIEYAIAYKHAQRGGDILERALRTLENLRAQLGELPGTKLAHHELVRRAIVRLGEATIEALALETGLTHGLVYRIANDLLVDDHIERISATPQGSARPVMVFRMAVPHRVSPWRRRA